MTEKITNGIKKISMYISLKQTMVYFGLMAALYVFSLFGTMFSSPDFTYAEF